MCLLFTYIILKCRVYFLFISHLLHIWTLDFWIIGFYIFTSFRFYIFTSFGIWTFVFLIFPFWVSFSVYIFAFGVYYSKQVNFCDIQKSWNYLVNWWFYFFLNLPKTLNLQFLQLDFEFSSTQGKSFFWYIPIWWHPIWMVVFT